MYNQELAPYSLQAVDRAATGIDIKYTYFLWRNSP